MFIFRLWKRFKRSMDFEVHISKEAEIEFETAECFFRSKNIHNEFLKDFFGQIDFLKITPLSFQLRYRDVRVIQLKHFNYSIHYIVKEQKVLILRILNQRQDF